MEVTNGVFGEAHGAHAGGESATTVGRRGY